MDQFIAQVIGFIIPFFAVLMTVGALIKAGAKEAPAFEKSRKKERQPSLRKKVKQAHPPQVHQESPPVEVTRLKAEKKHIRGRSMIIHHEILLPPLALRKK